MVPRAVSRLTPPAAKTPVRIKAAAEVRHIKLWVPPPTQLSVCDTVQTKKLTSVHMLYRHMVAAAFFIVPARAEYVLADSSNIYVRAGL